MSDPYLSSANKLLLYLYLFLNFAVRLGFRDISKPQIIPDQCLNQHQFWPFSLFQKVFMWPVLQGPTEGIARSDSCILLHKFFGVLVLWDSIVLQQWGEWDYYRSSTEVISLLFRLLYITSFSSLLWMSSHTLNPLLLVVIFILQVKT